MSRTNQRKKGESIGFSFDRGDLSIDGWICTVSWKKFKKDALIGSKLITPTDGVWEGFLTTSETASLSAGLHYLIAKMENLTTLEEETREDRFNITENWA